MTKIISHPMENQIKLGKAAIYARVSSQKQKDEETIDSQLESIKLYAKSKGYTINEKFIFIDNGVSGGLLQRPALDELRDVIRFETLEVLLVYAPDRLSRNYTHQLILMEEFRKNGVKICFLKEPPEANTPEAKMFQHFQGIFAEYERALILDRSRRGRLYKAKQGNPAMIPSLPFGYKRIREKNHTSILVVEEEAEVVREIFRLYIYELCTITEVARRITTKGMAPRKNGASWHATTIRNILNNPTYLGVSYFGKTERCEGNSECIRKYASKVFVKTKYARKKRLQEEWLPISVPQIIGENDFEQVQERLKKNKELASRNTKDPSLLQGIITCGLCGKPFYKRVRRNGKRSLGYYYCSGGVHKQLKKCSNKWVRQDNIDKHVFEEVFKLLKSPSLVQKELSRRAKEASNTDELEQREIVSRKERAKLSYETDRLLDAYQNGIVDLKELQKRSEGIEIRRKSIEKEIKGLQAIKIKKEGSFEFENIFENILQGMDKQASNLSFKKKRDLVRLLVEEIVIYEDAIKIVHCVSPLAISKEKCLLKTDGGG